MFFHQFLFVIYKLSRITDDRTICVLPLSVRQRRFTMQQVILTNLQLNFFDQYVRSLQNQGFKRQDIVESTNAKSFVRMTRDRIQLNYCKECLSAVPALHEHSCLVVAIHEL